VHQADAPALVPADVEHDAAALVGDGLERGVELRPAVAAARPEDVAGEALGVDPDQHVLAVAEVALHQRDVVGAVEHRLVADGAEDAVRGGICASATRTTCFSVRRRHAMRSAMEMMARSCVAANALSSSSRAMPLWSCSLTISQMTPPGPARPSGTGRPRPRCARRGAARRPRARAAG
jgi:hypothetical protein